MAKSFKKIYAAAEAGDFDTLVLEIPKAESNYEWHPAIHYQALQYAIDRGNKKAVSLIKKVKVSKSQAPLCRHNLLMAYLDPALGLECKPTVLKTYLTEYKLNTETLDKKSPAMDFIGKRSAIMKTLRNKQKDPAIQKIFDQVFKGAKWKVAR